MTSEHTATNPGRRGELLAAIGGGLAALANLGTTLAGAPDSDGADRMAAASGRAADRYRQALDREEKRRSARAGEKHRADALTLQRLRAGASIDLAERRERRLEEAAVLRAETAKMAAERADRAGERAERADRRAEERHAERHRNGQKSSRSPAFTWIHPESGERYTVDRATWDKSSYTLFQLVVDATRPQPDSRGYPAPGEWRRHCYDSYPTASGRDSYIMRHLPEVPEALHYLKRMARR